MTSDQESPQDTATPASDEPAATDKIVAAFGGIRPMAHKLGMPVTTVQGWKKRGAIPPQRHDGIRAAAQEHGIALDDALLAASASSDAPATATPGPAKPAKPAIAAAPSASATPPPREPPSPAPSSREQKSPGQKSRERAPGEQTAREQAGKTPQPASSKPPRQRPVLAMTALVLALISLVLVATAPFWTGPLYRMVGLPVAAGTAAGVDTARLESLEDRLATQERRTEEISGNSGSATGTAALTTQLQAMDRRLSAIERIATPELASRVGAIGGAVDALAADVARLDGALGNQRIGLTEARALVTGLEARADEVATQLADITATQRRDGRRIDRLVASDSATQALVLAIGQLRIAVDSGQPYAQPLTALRALAAGIDEAVDDLAALASRAASGIPDRDALKTGFTTMAQEVREAVLLPADADWMTQAVARIEGLVTVRPAPGEVDGDDVGAVLARAEGRLDNGDLTGAVAAVSLLEGDAAAAAAIWLRSAEARLAAEEALGNLNSFVIARLADNASDAAAP